MYAGFKEATGDYVAVMDSDLQDPPELLEDMLKYIKENLQIYILLLKKTDHFTMIVWKIKLFY